MIINEICLKEKKWMTWNKCTRNEFTGKGLCQLNNHVSGFTLFEESLVTHGGKCGLVVICMHPNDEVHIKKGKKEYLFSSQFNLMFNISAYEFRTYVQVALYFQL